MSFDAFHSDTDLFNLHQEISKKAFISEADAIQQFLPGLSFLKALEPSVYNESGTLIRALRSSSNKNGIEAFLQEYNLESSEGIAIMCLAEALLRIPDSATADRLIHGTFETANWEHHIGSSPSWLINASSWGLLLTGKIVNLSDAEGAPATWLARLIGKLGEPVIREALKAAMRHIGAQFVLGETIENAIRNSAPYEEEGFLFSYDMLGEGARTHTQAEHYKAAYLHALACTAAHAKQLRADKAPSISVKLSALHPRYHLLKHQSVTEELLPRLMEILTAAMHHNIDVSIDAEESTRLDIQLLIFTKIFSDPAFGKWQGLGYVLQAYHKRAYYLVDYLTQLSRKYNRRIPIRLVKGAYWDSEIKAAQIAGFTEYPVFTRKEHTDISYLACAGKIFASPDCFYPQFATHNARTVVAINAMAEHYGIGTEAYEFQRLHGMGIDLYNQVAGRHHCRIYAPVGEHKDLLAYLIRRLLENGANTSFVHLLMDENIPVETLLENPITVAEQHTGTLSRIPLPKDIYGPERLNSAGIDLGNLHACHSLAQGLAKQMLPFNTLPATLSVNTLIHNSRHGFVNWRMEPVSTRANILRRTADLFETERDQLLYLLMTESKKTIADAVAEVREAVDFCRYYATEAERLFLESTLRGPTGEHNKLQLHPRGTFICISPWNFPLAIFTGQIVAALVAGNSVIAKPAEQTPRIAAYAVSLMHQAGVPKTVLQLAIGDGKVGASLVSHTDIDGVVFTGSVETAQHINHTLAKRKGSIIPFIAETGGQNCMVVDSSALPEAAIDDIMLSAFGSAGQRCSALRVLFVQDDIADHLLSLLKGAMETLVVGDPQAFATDLGSVIDEDARQKLTAHIKRMKKSARLIAETPMDEHVMRADTYVLPHAFEISTIDELKEENFGPVLHVIRFKAGALQEVAEAINSTGYGLTFGIHSRINEHIEFFASHIKAGNIYINRSMIGATVGVQPFGGEGLSGTGPKAGGPYYLLRFVTERTVSNNTAAIGGNVTLLSA